MTRAISAVLLGKMVFANRRAAGGADIWLLYTRFNN